MISYSLNKTHFIRKFSNPRSFKENRSKNAVEHKGTKHYFFYILINRMIVSQRFFTEIYENEFV